MKNSNSISARLLHSVQFCALLGMFLSLSGNAWAYGETTSYVLEVDGQVFSGGGNALSEKELKSYDLSAPCKQISFYAKTSSTNSTEAKRIYLYEYDGSGSQLKKTTIDVNTTSTYKEYDLNITTRRIKFTAQSTYTKTVENLKVTRATTLALSPTSATSLDFGTVQTHSNQSKTITVDYNNDTYNQPFTSSCSNSGPFSITTTDAGENGSNHQITVNLSTSASGEFDETLTISMNGKSIQVPVKATIIGNTAMEWNQYFTDLIFNNPDIPLNARIYNPADKNQTISTNISYTIGDANIATIVNGSLHLIGNTGSTTITAEYAGDANHDACRETREIIVSSYAMPQWQNDWATAPSAGNQFYLYNKNAGGFVEAGKGENSPFTDETSASLWTYTNNQLQNGANKIGNRTAAASTNNTNVRDYTFDLNNGLFRIQYSIYTLCASTTNSSTFTAKIGSEYQWYLVSQDQMNYHAAAVDAINDYLLANEYAIIVGDVRDNLETAVHATSDWTNASDNLLDAIDAFVAEYDAIDNLSLANCDGYQMLYTGENKVKILDQTAVAKIATWNDDNLVLTPVAGTPQVIPAHTSVLIYDNTDTECVYTITQDDAATITENAFEYHNSSAMGEHTDYVLSKSQDDVVAFRKYTGDDNVADNHNVLVWRESPATPAPAVIYIQEQEHTPTALVPVYENENHLNDGRIFTIMGLEVSDMTQPGIYIMNGEKFIIR